MKKLHFIWIWGIWMSALARYYKNKWYQISWSDSEKSELIEDLENEWIRVVIWHFEENISWDEQKVFYTKAVWVSNPELKKAIDLNIKTFDYFQWLWEISKDTKCIWISGSHWKSTTTSMIWIILQELWLKPDVIVWTKVPNFWNNNYLAWDWEYLIVEACEYKDSFLSLNLYWAVILNIEADHLDHYKTEENYIKWYERFIENIPKDWFLVINKNDSNTAKIKTKAKCKIIEVGQSAEDLSKVPRFNIPWDHILFDWLIAMQTVKQITSADNGEIFNALSKFKWTWRRFEQVWVFKWAVVISDYAHHPTEISVTLKWAREKFWAERIVTIFEAHQYSRTIELFDDFCKSFWESDLVIIPSIYKVRDKQEDIDKMSPEILSKWINKVSDNSIFIDWFEKTKEYLEDNIEAWDVIMIMWAWPIDDLARSLV